MDGLGWKTLLRWMIWGPHYFRKHPYSLEGILGSLGCRYYVLKGDTDAKRDAARCN